ncbi:MAG: hypothetical protein II007_09860 [Gammaproteobacteria bacterium]|nr:hypothetical protein [Gammaproteobacteria bacterium]
MSLQPAALRLTTLSALFALLTACASEPQPPASEPLDVKVTSASATAEGEPGGVTRTTETITATVAAIDADKRTFVLEDDAGHRREVQAPAEMINFPQLAVGDRVKVELVVETVIFVTDAAQLPADGAEQLVVAAEEGAKPGLVAAEHRQVTAIVIAVDVERHTATLQFEDGSLRTVPVRADVDVTPMAVGKKVVMLVTAAMAITVTEQ